LRRTTGADREGNPVLTNDPVNSQRRGEIWSSLTAD
jgi:hypothetical protein